MYRNYRQAPIPLTSIQPFIGRGASTGATVNGGRNLLLWVAEALLEPFVLRERR